MLLAAGNDLVARLRAQLLDTFAEHGAQQRLPAAVLSTVLGVEVEAQSLSLEQAVAKGMPEVYATHEMLNVFDANAHPERMRELELPTTGFAEWAERNMR